MTAVPKGWQPDPFVVHELRFFSADGKPTRLVRDNNVESYDEPPIATPKSMSDSVMTRDVSFQSPAAPDAAEPTASIAHSVIPAGWFPDLRKPKQQRYWDGMSWTEHTSLTGSFLAPTKDRSGRLLPMAVTVAAVLLVAEVIGLVSIAGSSKTASNSPAQLSAITATTVPSPESVETGTATGATISSTTTTQATEATPPPPSIHNTPQYYVPSPADGST